MQMERALNESISIFKIFFTSKVQKGYDEYKVYCQS